MNVTLQIYSQQAFFKGIIWESKNIFLRFTYKSACYNVNVTICKVKNSIILISKVGKLGWIEYIDKDVFTALAYLGFDFEHNVNKYVEIFIYCFLARALSLLADHIS